MRLSVRQARLGGRRSRPVADLTDMKITCAKCISAIRGGRGRRRVRSTGATGCRFSIVIPALDDFHDLLAWAAHDTIDKPMLVRDPPRPPPCERTLQGFRLTDACEGVAFDVSDQGVDLLGGSRIVLLPI